MLNTPSPPWSESPSTGIWAVGKRSSLPEFLLSYVPSTRGLALNLINTGVFGTWLKPRY
jgi:hypothetical protein